MRSEFTADVEEQARKRAGGRCEKCGGLFLKKSQVDHIKPCALGGTNELSNAQVLCTVCHLQKTMDDDMPKIRKADRKGKRPVETAEGKTEIQRRYGV